MSQVRICPNCGKEHLSATFCPYCNAKVQENHFAAEKMGSNVKPSDIESAKSQFFLKNETLDAAFVGWGEATSILHQYVLITNLRVIYWERGLLQTGNRAFYYEDISDVREIRGLLYGGIRLNIHGAFEDFPNMNSGEIPLAVGLIRENINKNRTGKSVATSESIPDQIKKLAELRDNGILTEEEFISKKTDLLKRL